MKIQDNYSPEYVSDAEQKLYDEWYENIVKLCQYIIIAILFHKIDSYIVKRCIYDIRRIVYRLIYEDKCDYDKTEFYYMMMYLEGLGVNFEFLEGRDIVDVLKVIKKIFKVSDCIKNYIEYGIVLNMTDYMIHYINIFQDMLKIIDMCIEQEDISIFDNFCKEKYDIEFTEDIEFIDYYPFKVIPKYSDVDYNEIDDTVTNALQRIVHLYIYKLRKVNRVKWIKKMLDDELIYIKCASDKVDKETYINRLNDFDITPSFVYTIIRNVWLEYTNSQASVDFVEMNELIAFNERYFSYYDMIKEIIKYFQENYDNYLEIENIEKILDKYLHK